MAVFAIGDTHLSLSCDKPMDIFKGWDNYADRLKTNWNKVVSDGDTVVIPGDVSWAMSLPEAVKDFGFLHELKGKKLLLKGNHDYWWNTLGKMNAFLSENGFDSIAFIHNSAAAAGAIAVCGTRGWSFEDGENDKKVLLREAGRLKASIDAAKKLNGEPIVFLHYPPLSDTELCRELCDILVGEGIKRCYFGHLHGFVAPQNASMEYEGVRFELVSADHLGFCPKFIG